jgi:hypothetical protein
MLLRLCMQARALPRYFDQICEASEKEVDNISQQQQKSEIHTLAPKHAPSRVDSATCERGAKRFDSTTIVTLLDSHRCLLTPVRHSLRTQRWRRPLFDALLPNSLQPANQHCNIFTNPPAKGVVVSNMVSFSCEVSALRARGLERY